MISQVSFSKIRHFIHRHVPSSTIAKIALQALGYFVLGLTARALCRRFFSSTKPSTQEPETPKPITKEYLGGEIPQEVQSLFSNIDPNIVELLGGPENFNSFPIKFFPVQQACKDKVSNDDKFWSIYSLNPLTVDLPIYRGLDDWGCPFVCINLVEKNEDFNEVQYLFYQNHEESGLVWYLNKNPLFIPGQPSVLNISDTLLQVISALVETGESEDYRLGFNPILRRTI
jgi:hypothetical protein